MDAAAARRAQIADAGGEGRERVQALAPVVERKRLEMARALATNPSLLMLDEIAGGLTEHEVAELVGNIRNIHAKGISIIWIEHIVHALMSVVGRLIVINFGRKLDDGDPETVLNSPAVQEIYMGIAVE